MTMLARVVFVAFLAFVVLDVARADDVCRADATKLCAGVLQGDGRILTCLHANEAQLSPDCKKLVGVVGKKVKEIGAACGDDVWQYCSDVRMGGGRILKCLASNSTKISAGCQKMVQQTEEKSAEFKAACGGDVAKHCQNVQRGEGRVLACLAAKEAELAPACKTLMQPLLSMPAAPEATPATAPPAAPAAPPAAAPPATAAPAPATPPASAPAAAPPTPAPAAPPKK